MAQLVLNVEGQDVGEIDLDDATPDETIGTVLRRHMPEQLALASDPRASWILEVAERGRLVDERTSTAALREALRGAQRATLNIGVEAEGGAWLR